MNSEFGKLGLKDLGKGMLIAFFTIVLGGVYTSINLGSLPDVAQLKVLALAGVSAALSYLLKNLFTNSDNKLLIKEPEKSVDN